jgi:hypothetical protein
MVHRPPPSPQAPCAHHRPHGAVRRDDERAGHSGSHGVTQLAPPPPSPGGRQCAFRATRVASRKAHGRPSRVSWRASISPGCWSAATASTPFDVGGSASFLSASALAIWQCISAMARSSRASGAEGEPVTVGFGRTAFNATRAEMLPKLRREKVSIRPDVCIDRLEGVPKIVAGKETPKFKFHRPASAARSTMRAKLPVMNGEPRLKSRLACQLELRFRPLETAPEKSRLPAVSLRSGDHVLFLLSNVSPFTRRMPMLTVSM